MRRGRAHTLIEVIVVVFVMGFVIFGVFSLFLGGSRAYRRSILRTGLQGDSQRVAAVLEREVKLTHYASLGTESRVVNIPGGLQVRRDALAMAALSDWSDPDKFLGGVSPRWDRYVVLYATTEPEGRLVCQVIDPDANPTLQPYPGLASNIRDDPAANDDVSSSRILSDRVLSFEVEKVDANQLLDVRVRFRERGGKAMLSEAVVDETHELVMSLRAWNTFPNL
ncbi:MAG: hypothetical protein HY319_25335 [Armatimonadetes bacterium]|nr:hypothetical protein [Armatimonadota bacterium]